MIDQGIAALLAANAGIAALVGQRIYRMKAPPDLQQLPCLVYSFVGGAAEPTLTSRGVYRQRVQVDALAWGNGADATAATLRAEAIAALDGWTSVLADGTAVINTTVANPGTDFVEDEEIFRCMAEFYVYYTNPAS